MPRLGCLLLIGSLCQAASAAQPEVHRLEPQGVRRGAEAVVKISGKRIGELTKELVLYEPGIEVLALEPIDKHALKATLAFASDCPLGRHAVRVRTATGVSNLVTLHVGPFDAVQNVEPNDSIETAQPIPLERTVHGVIQPEDQDVFAIELAEGQRLSAEVEGLRLGRTFFDPVLELLDASGEVILANDDQAASHSDPFLTYTAPAGGTHYLRIRESAFRGDGRASYLLHVGDFPRPTAVYPAAAARGGETAVRWIDADGADATVTVPHDAGRTFCANANDAAGVAPTALPMWVTEQPPTREAEPNDRRKEATALPCPGVAAGVVCPAGDVDHFRLETDKGETLDIRVRARELRTPLDPVLRVFDAKGKRLAGNDDDRGKPDSYLRFKAPADGEYTLQIEDCMKRGGESYSYVVDVARPRPVAEIKLDERRRYEATVLEVPRGGRTAALLTVTRRDFGGAVEVAFDALPAGVSVESYPLAANYNRVPVVLSADADAPLDGLLSGVSVSPVDTSQGLSIESRFEQATWLVRGRNNRAVWSHFAKRAPIAVTKRLPFELSLVPPKAPLCQNGSIELRVNAVRDEGFDRRIAVQMLYHSPGLSSNRSRALNKDATTVTIPVTANAKARVGDWPIAVVGQVSVNGRVFASTGFVTLRVAEPFFDLSVPTLSGKQGETLDLTIGLSPRTEFDGLAKLELVGLPPGVRADPVEVSAGATSAAFRVVAAADAKPGRHRGVGCRVTIDVEGEPATYRQGYAELRIDPSDPPPERTAGRPDREATR